MKNYKIKTSFVSDEGTEGLGLRKWYYFYDSYFNIRENFLEIDAIHDLSVRLRTGSSSANINCFRSHTLLLRLKLYFFPYLNWSDHIAVFFCFFVWIYLKCLYMIVHVLNKYWKLLHNLLLILKTSSYFYSRYKHKY